MSSDEHTVCLMLDVVNLSARPVPINSICLYDNKKTLHMAERIPTYILGVGTGPNTKMLANTPFPLNLGSYESHRVILSFHLDAVTLLDFPPTEIRNLPIGEYRGAKAQCFSESGLDDRPKLDYHLQIASRRNLKLSGCAAYANVERLHERIKAHAKIGEVSVFGA